MNFDISLGIIYSFVILKKCIPYEKRSRAINVSCVNVNLKKIWIRPKVYTRVVIFSLGYSTRSSVNDTVNSNCFQFCTICGIEHESINRTSKRPAKSVLKDNTVASGSRCQIQSFQTRTCATSWV